MKASFVYIMTNHSRTLYTGVTSQLEQRVYQHKNGVGGKFTSTYKINQLVHYEELGSMYDAITREKQIKGWTRAKKLALIEKENRGWIDLAAYLDEK